MVSRIRLAKHCNTLNTTKMTFATLSTVRQTISNIATLSVSIINDIVMNKNFPPGLFIFPSSYPSTFRSTLDSLDTHVEELSSVLSAQAQDDAIAKFGIAGRVWYTPPTIISWSPCADGT